MKPQSKINFLESPFNQRLCASVLLLFVVVTAFGNEAIEKASRLELQGQFKQAAAALTSALKDAQATDAEKRSLSFELDRLRRIQQDYPFTKDALYAELKKSVRDITRSEYDQWVEEGRFDTRTIDGQRYFMTSSVSNLYFRYPKLESRRLHPRDKKEFNAFVYDTVTAIKRAAVSEKTPYVLPRSFDVSMTVTANANAAPAGEVIRAWMPVPRDYPFQDGFQITYSSAPVLKLADATSPMRSLYLEQPAAKDKPTEFKLQYHYNTRGVYFDVQPDKIRTVDNSDATLQQFTREGPHVVFTPELRELSKKIAGDETNPALKAKKFYDWISGNIKYSYAIEYSTIRNISDYCRSHGYGDCGQEALLFITLCRLNGIPARWQSGWNTVPGGKSIHDWSEIYLAPYGWIPVDPYMGIYAMRYMTTLDVRRRQEVRDFYFGGLDQYRMIANSDHNQELNPPKNSMRSDDVDFQRGELEWGNQNIYFDKYSYDLQWKELKPSRIE